MTLLWSRSFHLSTLSTCYMWYLSSYSINICSEWKNKCGLSRTQICWCCSVFLKTMKTIHDDVECFTDIPESPGSDIIYLPFQKGPWDVSAKENIRVPYGSPVLECTLHSPSLCSRCRRFSCIYISLYSQSSTALASPWPLTLNLL